MSDEMLGTVLFVGLFFALIVYNGFLSFLLPKKWDTFEVRILFNMIYMWFAIKIMEILKFI